eukprot:m51a1_g7264 hypothetical protein (156) ;mRNA; r:197526-199970
MRIVGTTDDGRVWADAAPPMENLSETHQRNSSRKKRTREAQDHSAPKSKRSLHAPSASRGSGEGSRGSGGDPGVEPGEGALGSSDKTGEAVSDLTTQVTALQAQNATLLAQNATLSRTLQGLKTAIEELPESNTKEHLSAVLRNEYSPRSSPPAQ